MDKRSGIFRNRQQWFMLVTITLLLLTLLVFLNAAAAQEPASVTKPDSNNTDGHSIYEAPAPDVCASGCQFYSIQAAINAAADGATLILASETFTESVTVSRTLTLQGAGAGSTIVQAAGTPGIATTRVITIDKGVSVTLDGLSIRYGNVTGDGGGILNMGSLTLTHSTVYSNSASYQGGGIHNDGYGKHAILRLISSQVMSNTATSTGGGIRNYSYDEDGQAMIELVDSTVRGNSSGTGGGVASYANAAGTTFVTITHSTVYSNSASTHGGGVDTHSNQDGSASHLLVSHSTISDNSVGSNGTGGGISGRGSDYGNTSLTIALSTVSGNSAEDGGGLANTGSSTSTVTTSITRCTFSENRANDGPGSLGGGVYNSGSTSATVSVEIEASTFSANSADSNGGGVANNGTASFTPTMIISHSTFSDNTALGHALVAGGGIYNYWAALSIATSIVANSPSGSDCYNGLGVVANSGHNLVENDYNCGLAGSDPKLDPLADNGGGTWTHALQAGSTALDAIMVDSCGATIDQRGVSRPQNSGCDIGAFEAVTNAWVDDDWDHQGDVNVYDDTLIWGANAFGNVNQAVDAVVGSTVHVLPGTYTETLDLTKSVTIIGDGGAAQTALQAANAAGIAASRVVTVSAGISVTLEGLTIRYGQAASGGGILNQGTLTLTESMVLGNTASSNGGGIFNGGSASPAYLTVLQSTVAENTASGGSGGGLLNNGSSGIAAVTAENSTFSGNSASSAGGIGSAGASAALTLTLCTVSDNSASSSVGGLGNVNGSVTLAGSILANSTGGTNCASNVAVTNGGSNLVEGGGCTIADGGDPRLGPLQDNGGSTWTHAVKSGSPALDAILAGSCPVNWDQRGFKRPRDTGCEIGAYEAVTEVWVNDDWTGQSDVDAYNPDLIWDEDAYSTVRDGLTAVSGSTVHVLAGTYTETLTIDKPVEIIGDDGASNTILQAAGAPGIAPTRVITVTEGVTVSLEGLTIRFGFANGSGAGYSRDGGGILNMGVLTLTNSTVYSCTAPVRGGGIYNAGEERSVSLTIEGSEILSNTAESRGGGVYNRARDDGLASLSLSNSIVAGNWAQFDGGGLFNAGEYGTATLSIAATTVTRNLAPEGGGLFNNCDYGDASVQIVSGTFSDNTATETGGAIHNYGYEECSAPISITASLISGNTAEDAGGGIYNSAEAMTSTAPVNILNSTLSGNSVLNGDGGGIYNECYEGQAGITLTESTLSGNSAPNGDGGGAYSYAEDVEGMALIDASHCTLWGNSASGTGGGIRAVDATFVFSNTILAGSPSGGDCTQTGSTITDGGYNLVEDGSCLSQPSSLTADPELGPLQAYGGPASGVGGQDLMLTHALLPGSPAIDDIPPGLCPDPADQRGYGRPFGLGCDIGAFEMNTYSVAVVKTVDDGNPETGQTITFTIVVGNSGPGTSNLLVSDALPTGLSFVGPISLDPPDAGTVGTAPPTLASDLTISANHQVTVTFAVSVSYGLAGGKRITNTASVRGDVVGALGSVTLVVGNAPPDAVDDGGMGFGTDENTILTTGSVLTNDSDPNGDTLTVFGHDSAGTIGQVTDKGDGTFGYDPDGKFKGLVAGEQVTDTFTYTVGDGRGGTDDATVTITIDGVDDSSGYQVFLPVVLRGR